LGDDCPVCENNKRIIRDNPNEFRKVSSYAPRVERHSVNVLDRTPAKVCPSCGKEYKKEGQNFPTSCTCGASLVNVEVKPLNKIKILSKGKDLFSQLNILQDSILDDKKEPVGLKNFDISLFVSGTGRDTKTTAVPQITSNDKIEISKEDLFSVKNTTIKLSVTEMLDLMNGVQLRDILTARKASASDSELEEEVSTTSDQIESTINELFN